MKAVLIVGSPHGFKSNSNSLGTYLLDKLKDGGYEVGKVHAQVAVRSLEKEAEMLVQVADSDLLILAFPLYVDCLPASLILALEKIANYRKTAAKPKSTRVLAIVNNGFPDSSQNATAISICKQFAKETGYEWAGGLMLGAGQMIGGAPLEEAPMMKNVMKALDLAAQNLLEGSTVSNEATELMAKSVMPKFLLTMFANMSWKSMAKPYGTQKRLRDRP